MSEDVETFEELQKSHPKVTMVQIKLEELATDPFNQTRRLFQQLGKFCWFFWRTCIVLTKKKSVSVLQERTGLEKYDNTIMRDISTNLVTFQNLRAYKRS